MTRKASLILALCLTPLDHLSGQTSTPEITAEELKAHVKFLASDESEGRASGTEGNQKAAEYIADLMAKYNLEPAGNDGTYFQSFDFVSSVELGQDNSLAFEGSGVIGGYRQLEVDADFRPFAFTTNETVSGPLAFVGYGISAPDNDYDDYKDIEVTGKVAVVLRYSPDGSDPHGELNRFSSFRNKGRTARDKGAKGLIIVTGRADEEEDELVKLRFDHSFASSGILVISMKRSVLEDLLRPHGLDLAAIQDSINQMKKPITFDLPNVEVTITTNVEKIISQTANIAGYLEGADPESVDEVIVLGAHMDHLGYGGPGSGSLEPDTHAIHNGADDNASGTAGLLELMQAFAATRENLKRDILFIAFSGEELGTLGSRHYVNNPYFPLNQSIAMINMDMIGRLENRSLTVYGTGTSPDWNGLLDKYNVDSMFTLERVEDGFGPSDHSQFYAKDIPVLFFFTGTHSDYHKPSDDWEKLDYLSEEKIVCYIYDIAKDINVQTEKPVFVKVESASPMAGLGDRRAFSVTLGIIPDYGGSSEGMKIGGIRPQGPAEKAGLQAGDVIVRMAGSKVLNIYDYMGILGELKHGDEVEVEVMREGKRLIFEARMQKRR
ncbi:MAG: M20/M25/M40 family metallo-hydrolase [Ignavibacteria bacterium]|nr:M20/M25/M40 family metallo-hydrolase [Ignavibacteria bacterium]